MAVSFRDETFFNYVCKHAIIPTCAMMYLDHYNNGYFVKVLPTDKVVPSLTLHCMVSLAEFNYIGRCEIACHCVQMTYVCVPYIAVSFRIKKVVLRVAGSWVSIPIFIHCVDVAVCDEDRILRKRKRRSMVGDILGNSIQYNHRRLGSYLERLFRMPSTCKKTHSFVTSDGKHSTCCVHWLHRANLVDKTYKEFTNALTVHLAAKFHKSTSTRRCYYCGGFHEPQNCRFLELTMQVRRPQKAFLGQTQGDTTGRTLGGLLRELVTSCYE